MLSSFFGQQAVIPDMSQPMANFLKKIWQDLTIKPAFIRQRFENEPYLMWVQAHAQNANTAPYFKLQLEKNLFEKMGYTEVDKVGTPDCKEPGEIYLVKTAIAYAGALIKHQNNPYSTQPGSIKSWLTRNEEGRRWTAQDLSPERNILTVALYHSYSNEIARAEGTKPLCRDESIRRDIQMGIKYGCHFEHF